MKNEKNISTVSTIREIEALTQKSAAAIAEEQLEIKDHNVYLVDLGGYFGYSALVYAEGMHIYYANDYALHHPNRSKEDLRAFYVSSLGSKLFTETELSAPTTDPDEISRRRYYVMNYYSMRRPYISGFQIMHNDAEVRAYKRKIAGMTLNPISYAYYSDSAFVSKCIALYHAVERAAESNADNFDYWKRSFLSEMINHEYAINWQADYDTISAFANVSGVREYENREALFSAANFTDLQRRAYDAARAEYYRSHADF